MEQQDQAKFEGWAVVEIFGHQKYAGHVTTQPFGQAVMFRVDVPEIPAEDRTITDAYEHFDEASHSYAPVGAKVKVEGIQAYTKIFGAGAIYGLTPCTEEVARKAVIQMAGRRPIKLLEMPAKAIAAADDVTTDHRRNVIDEYTPF